MPQLTAQQKKVLEDTPPNLADWSSLK
jgi:hypothetical protein